MRFYLYQVISILNKEKKQARQKMIRCLGRVKGITDISGQDAIKIFARDNNACQKCGGKENLTLDHKISLLDGGTNKLDNLQVLCSWHNQSKGRGNDSQA